MKTSVNNTVWEVKFFPYKLFHPLTDKAEDTLKEADPYVLKKGITSISVSRSKNSPYGTASITVVGVPEKSFQKGAWVIVYSKYGELSGTDKLVIKDGRLPRFAGQLVSVTTSYTADASGNVRQVTNLTIREWSFIFKTPIRLDARAAEQSFTRLAIFLGTDKGDKKPLTEEDVRQAVKDGISSFDFIKFTLKVIGALSELGNQASPFDNPVLNKFPDFPKVALNAPAVHSKFMSELGIKGKNSKSAFSTGMVDYIFGVSEKKINLPNFKGVFEGNKFEEYKNSYSTLVNRPYVTNHFALYAKGFSFFDLVQSVGDMDLNELFTDLVYTSNGDGKISARPTIFYRSRPTILKSEVELYKALSGGEELNFKWSYFDDLPRIKIDSVYIKSLSILDTSESSPNYIRPEISSSIFAYATQLSQLEVKKLESEMYRFGGVSSFVPVVFNQGVLLNKGEKKQKVVEKDKKEEANLQKWLSDVKNFTVLSESFNYNKPSLRMVIKDNNIPISVGMNIEFKLTDITYVAHIESLDIEHGIDASGVIYTNTVINCSRLVYENPRTKELLVLQERMFSDIFVKSSELNEESSSSLGSTRGGFAF